MFFATTSTKALRWVHWRFRPGQRSENVYRGVYGSFAEARQAIGLKTDYDSEVGAGLYRDRLDQVFPEDYPVLFWLQPHAATLQRVFDFGGHVGLHWYGFKRLVQFSPSIQWVVSDVPAVAREGEVLARSRDEKALKFGSGFDGLDGSDVLLSSGALQYLERTALGAALRACKAPPKHLLLNKLPVGDGPAFVTVQDAWQFEVPYTVFNRGQLVSELESLGYQLKDSWKNPRHHCLMLADPAHSIQEFSGFCFSRSG